MHGPTTSSCTAPPASSGRLLAGYLAEHAPPEARIALAGRSRERAAGGARRAAAGGPGLGRARRPTRRTAPRWPRWPRRPGCWRPPSGPTPATGCRSSRPARRPAPTTPTSPARCCSSATRSTGSTRSPGGPAPGSCTPAGTTRSRRTSPRCCSPSGPGATTPAGCATSGWSPPLRGGFSGGTIDSMRAPARGGAAATRRCAGWSATRTRSAPTGPPSPPPASRADAGPPSRTAGRPVDGAVRHGAVQHPDRAAQQRAAGLGVRRGTSATAR